MALSDYQTDERMALKRRAIPLPDLVGKTVLDVGCEAGYWCKLASDAGASRVLGLDRGRDVRGVGYVDLVAQNRARGWPRCEFEKIDLGREWREFGAFDVVLVMSVYHHVHGNCGDHDAIWAWLREQTALYGVLIFEGPLDKRDSVSRRWAGEGFTREAILFAASRHFDVRRVGPALHEPTREVLRCTPRREWTGVVKSGAGGASKAFAYADGRRCREVEAATGVRPFPGSLNVHLSAPFDWDGPHVEASVLDVVERGKGLDVEWKPRNARLYPVRIRGRSDVAAFDAWAFRFDGEKYRKDFVELVADVRLRDHLGDEEVRLCARFD